MVSTQWGRVGMNAGEVVTISYKSIIAGLKSYLVSTYLWSGKYYYSHFTNKEMGICPIRITPLRMEEALGDQPRSPDIEFTIKANSLHMESD